MRIYGFLKQWRRPESWTNYRAAGRREGMRSHVGVSAAVMGKRPHLFTLASVRELGRWGEGTG